ncbi:LytR/AlgR family response regulator transcription factor [Tannockella kyphosi]|uniref:LytR/AlgR family response regulator transcription factor n=1 Tax=Tannockella kyphosi TaxID=2899121 RepID=UPI002012C2D1|nr:LytTR family DNA-binding domain-containing protein [Tannockella kyphosi]
MHIAICDDNIQEITTIISLLDNYQIKHNQEITYDAFDNAKTLLNSISKHSYDLLLLDIVMPEISGIEVASKIREFDKDIPIVFLTMSPEFAITSYRLHAKDYLLKPVDKKLLFDILDSLKETKEDFILIKSNDAIKQIVLNDIVYIEVVSRKVWIYLKDGTTMVSPGTLFQLEAKLSMYCQFYKPHRCYLINFEHVIKIDKEGIHTSINTIIPVPRSSFVKTKNDYMNYFMTR